MPRRTIQLQRQARNKVGAPVPVASSSVVRGAPSERQHISACDFLCNPKRPVIEDTDGNRANVYLSRRTCRVRLDTCGTLPLSTSQEEEDEAATRSASLER